MVILPLAPDQTIAQMWSNGARGGEIESGTFPPNIIKTGEHLTS